MGTRRLTTADSQQQEVDRNYEAFMKVLPNLIKSDAGRTALMRDGEVIMCFDTERDAIETGRRFFEDRRFSIQIGAFRFRKSGLVRSIWDISRTLARLGARSPIGSPEPGRRARCRPQFMTF